MRNNKLATKRKRLIKNASKFCALLLKCVYLFPNFYNKHPIKVENLIHYIYIDEYAADMIQETVSACPAFFFFRVNVELERSPSDHRLLLQAEQHFFAGSPDSFVVEKLECLIFLRWEEG